MHKPADLYGKPRLDPPYENVGGEPVPNANIAALVRRFRSKVVGL